MKCPKCGYLGFEEVERCRNCGYEFSLARPAAAAPDLSLQASGQDLGLGDDLGLGNLNQRASVETPSTPPDLPLFETPSAADRFTTTDDTPLITKASPPRAPLAVRRATPELPRLRAEPRAQALDLGFDTDRPIGHGSRDRARSTQATTDRRRANSADAPDDQDAESSRNAGLIARGVAAAADLLILAVVNVLVVYFTMQICGLSVLELPLLPKAPLLAFLVIQNGGYLVAFTAGGQTLGKMALGIRVVSADADEPLSVGRAALRTLMWAVLVLPAGLGFLTAAFRSDRRGFHDRFAGTRVVRTVP
jgi:uncharacterized RDD family membrane protein YckC